MRRLIAFSSLLVAVFLFAAASPPAAANTYDKLTYLTFSAPVQIPGTVLDPGTYRFHLTNPETSRNVMQVLSNDGETVYAMFHTIPDSRMEETKESMVTFKEVAAGVPQPIHSLFYGGERFGYEFLYPSEGWVTLAEEVPQSPIAYFRTPAPIAPEVVFEPTPEPAPIVSEVAPEPVAEPAQAPAPAELPRTASLMPLTAIGGFASLLAGVGLALVRRRLD